MDDLARRIYFFIVEFCLAVCLGGVVWVPLDYYFDNAGLAILFYIPIFWFFLNPLLDWMMEVIKNNLDDYI